MWCLVPILLLAMTVVRCVVCSQIICDVDFDQGWGSVLGFGDLVIATWRVGCGFIVYQCTVFPFETEADKSQ